MWSEPEPLDLSDPEHPRCPRGSTLWVLDLKSGEDAHVEPAERNAQLDALAVMAAKWTGAMAVVPSVLFLRKGAGDWDTPERAWGSREIAAGEARIRRDVARGREAAAAIAEGRDVTYVEGNHCTYCASATRCPAKTGMIKSIVGSPVPSGAAPLTREERVWMAKNLGSLESFARKAREVLKASVDADGPIDLGDGLVWGSQPTKRAKILPRVALPILREELGDDLAAGAIEETISREAVEAAAKEWTAQNGIKRGVSRKMGAIMARVGSAGGLLSEPRVEYRAHRPAATATADEEA
jgi:hypothetical protein